MSGIMLATGRHKLRSEVDLAAFLGLVAGSVLAIAGVVCSEARTKKLNGVLRVSSWLACVFLVGLGVTELFVIYWN